MSGATNLLPDLWLAVSGFCLGQQKVLGPVLLLIRQEVDAADHLTLGLDKSAAGIVLGVEGVVGGAARR